MKKLIVLSAICLSAVFLKAQSLSPQVIASAGAYFDNGTVSLSWTLGEPVIETHTSVNVILTQGFQQPDLLPVGIKNVSMEDLFIKMYPNPTFNIVKLDLKYSNTSTIDLQLVNALGQIIKTDKINVEKNKQNNFQFDLSELASGVYQVRLTDKGKLLNTYKIQKFDN
jgi:hypothetical protein